MQVFSSISLHFNANNSAQWAQEALSFAAVSGAGHLVAGTGSKIVDEWKKHQENKAVKEIADKGNKYIQTPEKFYLDQGLIKISGSRSLAEQKLRSIWTHQNIDEGLQDAVLSNMSETDIRQELKNTIQNSENSAILDAQTEQRIEDIEEQVYNKLLKGNVTKSVALANAKLFGQFFKKYGAKNIEAFNKWFDKFNVQYDVPNDAQNNVPNDITVSNTSENIKPAFDEVIKSIEDNNLPSYDDAYKYSDMGFGYLRSKIEDAREMYDRHNNTLEELEKVYNQKIEKAKTDKTKNKLKAEYQEKVQQANAMLENTKNMILNDIQKVRKEFDTPVYNQGVNKKNIYYEGNNNFKLEKYSINENEKISYKQYSTFIEKVLEKPNRYSGNIKLGNTPNALLECGLDNLPLETTVENILKMKNKVKHNVTPKTLKALPYLLNNPLAVFKSKNGNDKIIVLLNAKGKTKKTIVITIDKNNKKGINEVNFITSGYEKNLASIKDLLKNNLIKIKKNVPNWLQELKNSLNDSVSENHNLVNADPKRNNNSITDNNKNFNPKSNTYLQSAKIKQPYEYDYIHNQVTGEKINIEMNEDITVEEIQPQKISSDLPFNISQKPSDNKKELIKSLNLGNNKTRKIENNNTNEFAIIKDKTIEKSLSNTSVNNDNYKDFCIILNNIESLFQNAQKILSYKDTKNNTDLIISRYANIAQIGKNNYLLEFVLKDNGEISLYSVNTVKDKKTVSRKRFEKNSMHHDTANNSIAHIKEIFKSKVVEKYNKDYKNLQKKSKNNTYFQEADDINKAQLIAGYSYEQVLDKANEIVAEADDAYNAGNDKLVEELMAKYQILEDAIESVVEESELYNSDKLQELYLNVYYIMNNQEIPKEYIESEKFSQKNYKDLVEFHNKKKEQAERNYYGYFKETEDENIITIMAKHDSSTALHELGHLFLNGLNEMAAFDENAQKQLQAVNKWLGAVNGEYTVEQHEKFARSFEAYLYKGKAPNNYLRQVFENFKEWLKSVYHHITDIENLGADISDEVQELFDNIFGSDEFYNERKQSTELLRKIRKTVRKQKYTDIPFKDDKDLDEVEKRHKEISYQILSAATGKSVKYLKSIFETKSDRKSFSKKRENIELLLDDVGDKISSSGGMLQEWREFYSVPEDELGSDYELASQALDTIINKDYKNPENIINDRYSQEAEYYEKIVNDANLQYSLILKSFKSENRNIVLGAYYEWINSLDASIREDYENKFIYDTAIIERDEKVDKFDKVKRDIISKALELENQYSINANEKYIETVKEIMKKLNFLQPSDKAKLTANVLDIPSTSILMARLDEILDIAKTMEDVNYRRNLEKEIHKELQTTKNVKKNGRTVGKYDYKTNKIFEKLRTLDGLSAEQANEQRLELSKFVSAEDNGLSYENKLYNKFLSYKAGGRTFANTQLMKELYDEIVKIKLIGKYAKSEIELQEALSEEKDIDELINIVQNKKDANIVLKGYVNGFANLESALNALFNKSIKEKYASEILYAETQAQAWQYEQKQNFEKEVAKIYNLPQWCWDKKILEYLGEKHTYSEFRRTYDDKTGDLIEVLNIDRTLTKMDIIGAYIWSKNKVLNERLKNQFGEEQLVNYIKSIKLIKKNKKP